MYKLSSFFWPVQVTPKNAVLKTSDSLSRSQRLMIELGLIKPTNHGTFQILPMAQRAIEKCIEVIDSSMRSAGGQKISLPVLTSATLWKRSGRLDGDITEFFIVRDRNNKEFLLSPTHEEAITSMLSTFAPISYRQLPLRFYQIGPKFRDELKPRFGLIRAKEFLMKDMYTFDDSNEAAIKTYEDMIKLYSSLFQRLEVPFVKVKANTGMMGGIRSHEFHYLSAAGEDKIFYCNNCDSAFNEEIMDRELQCSSCLESRLTEKRGIEIGHAFLLGDKYTQALGGTFLNTNGKPKSMIMGCYGIGVTRLVAAAIEVLSSDTHIKWPLLLAPFDVCIIGPKKGSKEESRGDLIEKNICDLLSKHCGNHEILIDDRKSLTIGKRLSDIKRLGLPLLIVIGSKVLNDPPKVELHFYDQILECSINEIEHLVISHLSKKRDLLYESFYSAPAPWIQLKL